MRLISFAALLIFAVRSCTSDTAPYLENGIPLGATVVRTVSSLNTPEFRAALPNNTKLQHELDRRWYTSLRFSGTTNELVKAFQGTNFGRDFQVYEKQLSDDKQNLMRTDGTQEVMILTARIAKEMAVNPNSPLATLVSDEKLDGLFIVEFRQYDSPQTKE